MARLSQIVRNKADVTIEVDGTDDAGVPIKVPVTVTYRPRLVTQAFREEFGRHMLVLVAATKAAEAAQEAGDAVAAVAAMDAPGVDQATDAMAQMTLGLIEGWDLTDEDGTGKEIPVPFPRTADEVKHFPAPEMFQAVLQGVMAALNPNRTADEASSTTSGTPSSAT